MSDKLKLSLMNRPEFAMGEQVDNAKLNAAFEQIQFGMERIEGAIGDLTADDEDNNGLSADLLHLYTLGRNLGANGIAGPVLNGNENFVFEDQLRYGRNSWRLPYIPKDTAGTLNYSISTNNSTNRLGENVFVSDVTPDIPSAAGEYAYHEPSNSLISYYTLIGGITKIEFTSHLGAENNHGFFSAGRIPEGINVIPPLQQEATCLLIKNSLNTNFEYEIGIQEMPLKYKLPISKTNNERPNASETWNFGLQTKTSYGLNVLSTSTHLAQYKLPYSVTSMASESEIPKGHVYLFDEDSETTILQGRYYYKDQTSIWYKGQSLDTSVNGRYRLINHGGYSHSELLESLRHDMMYHEHKGPRAISHSHLANNIPPVNTNVSATLSRGFYKSYVPSWHDHPQYLHRGGWSEGYDSENLSNLFLGHLFIAASATNLMMDRQTYAEATNGVSYKLLLGNPNTYLQWGTDKAQDKFLLINTPQSVLAYNPVINNYDQDDTHYYHIDMTYPGNSVILLNSSDFSVKAVGTSGIAVSDSQRVKADILTEGASVTFSESRGSILEGNLRSGNITFAQNTNAHIFVNGTVQGTAYANANNQSLEYHVASLNEELKAPFSGHGKYIKADNYVIDTPRRKAKVYNPIHWFQFGTSAPTSDFEREEHIAETVLSPSRLIRATSSNNEFRILASPHNAGCYLNVEEDSYISTLTINLHYQICTLKLYYIGMDGTAIEATSTTPPNMNGSSTTLVWDLGTNYGVLGPRFPNASPAVDLLLVVENGATTPAGANMGIRMMKNVYYQMRS